MPACTGLVGLRTTPGPATGVNLQGIQTIVVAHSSPAGPFSAGRVRGRQFVVLTRTHVEHVVGAYVRAWTEQDPDLIVTVFTESAVYHERVFEEPIRTREGISVYWQEKVVESQANIECRLLALYVDGSTAIAEWEAQFDDRVEGVRKRMREVAILEFEDGLIASLREYWATEILGDPSADDGRPNVAGRCGW